MLVFQPEVAVKIFEIKSSQLEVEYYYYFAIIAFEIVKRQMNGQSFKIF